MPDKKPIGERIKNVAAVVAAVIALQGAASWVFKDKIDSYIVSVMEENKGPSTRGDLAKEMDVRKELVVIKLGKMYQEFKETQKNIESFNNTWIPHLEQEKLTFHVGFFAYLDDDGSVKIKYRDFDGEEYRSWHDSEGWYYMKQGFRFYR